MNLYDYYSPFLGIWRATYIDPRGVTLHTSLDKKSEIEMRSAPPAKIFQNFLDKFRSVPFIYILSGEFMINSLHKNGNCSLSDFRPIINFIGSLRVATRAQNRNRMSSNQELPHFAGSPK